MSQRIPFAGFVGSAFHAQSKRLDTQDLWSWYVERAGSPYSKSGQALLPCPGFTTFATLPTTPVRGLFAQNDQAFAVAGNMFYELTPSGGFLARPLTALDTTTWAAPVITVSPLSPQILEPRAPTIMHGGSTGATLYGYVVTAINREGETKGSPEAVTAIGNAALSSSNWNIISWPSVQGATGYKIYRTKGTTADPAGRLIKTVAQTTLVINDTGDALAVPPAVVASPPVANTTGAQPGTTTYGYKVTALLGLGESAASAQGTTAIGKNPLTSVDYTIVTWKKVINAKGYRVYRTFGGSLPPRLIAEVSGGDTLTVRDTGEIGEAITPPTVNTTGTGTLADDGGVVTFCSSGDAGEQLLFVSGDTAYCYDLESHVLAPVVSGASSAGFIDSYFVVLDASTSTLKVSESFEGFLWDATQVYQRSRAGDKWLAMAVTSNNIWLIGSQTGEVWVGTGNADNRFQPYTPVFIETGVLASDTMIRVSGDTMIWVAQDKDGAGYVVKTNGYAPEKVSTSAVDHAIQNLSSTSDGSAFSYQQDGHTFYVLSFPTAHMTWVFDLSTGEWHRRGYWDPDLMAFRVYRPQCHAFAFGAIQGLGLALVGDRASGVVASMHPRYGTDIDGVVIRRVRQCPHVTNKDEEVTFDRLQLDMDVGQGLAVGQGSDPTIMLSYSNDSGNTWGYELWRCAGRQGDYRIQVAWSRLGTAKQRVFRLVVTDPIPWRLVGAWLELE